MKKVILLLLSTLTATAAALWVGLKVKPKPLPRFPSPTSPFEYTTMPSDLPPPVARFYSLIMGDRLPLIESAVLSGRGTLRFAGLTFPARLRFTHKAGRDYRHYIEATIFGLPFMKVNEFYRDGKARLELPFGVVENEPKVDMAANLGLWAESIWLPSIYLTDPRVRWEAIDDAAARLIVPFGDEEDNFTVAFDPSSGLIRTLEALRYRDAADEAKILWRNTILAWESVQGFMIPVSASVTWMDQGTPWLEVTIEEVVYNADVSDYIRASGP